jgi:hypothetical protein
MKHVNLIFFLLVMLMINSCSKEAGQNSIGPVQFFFKGNIGSEAITYEAGENNYILNTFYDDAGAIDVLKMFGEFKDKTNENADYLRFQFYGYDSVNNTFILDNVFNQSNLFSYSQDTTQVTSGVLELKFDALNLFGSTHTWNFGDGSPTAIGATTNHIYSVGGPVNVSLTSNYSIFSCTDSITNTIDLSNLLSCQVQFDVQALSLDSFQYIATAGFTNYDWKVNGLSQQMNNATISQWYNDSLRREIQLIATKSGCSSVWKAVIAPNGGGCFAGFKYSILQQPITVSSTRPPFKTCIITYRRDGVIYSSYKPTNSNQSNRVVFSVSDASPYEKNAAGQETIRVDGSVNTFLYNINNANDSIPIVSSQVSIAVARP